MPAAKAPPRVKGPYSERGGTRFRIRICEEFSRRDVYFRSLAEAQAAKERIERELPERSQRRLLEEVLDEYIEDKVRRGACGEESAKQHRERLRAFLEGSLHEPIGKLAEKRAAELYETLVATPTRKTGQPPTAATHRFYLKLAQSLFQWAVRKGYVQENPFASVQPIGRPSRGKKQLRFDEAERFISTGFRLFEEKSDWLALCAVTTLLLGLRASEALHLRVRDLDCGGTKLWVAAGDAYQGQKGYQGKTANARRDPEVPAVLQPRLLRLTAGRAADEYLFGATSDGKPRCRQLLHAAVRRVCDVAGVPRVCPHSLRGLWATAGVRSGAVSHAVAATLGHGSFDVTAKHYVQPGTLEGNRTARLVELLSLSEPPQKKSAAPLAELSAEEILATLPAETVAKLVSLATRPRQ
jgi:integrase